MQEIHPTTGHPLLVEMRGGAVGRPVIRFKGRNRDLLPFLNSLAGVYPGARLLNGQAAADLHLLARRSEV